MMRCERCGGVCRGGERCPMWGKSATERVHGEPDVTDRERMMVELDHADAEWVRAVATWDRAVAELERARAEFDRTYATWDRAVAELDRAHAEFDRADAERVRAHAALSAEASKPEKPRPRDGRDGRPYMRGGPRADD